MADQPFEMTLQVGRYEVQKLLGKGATGTVYLAKDSFSGKEVALKTIEPEVFRDPEFGAVYRQQFLNESSLAGKLRHPHIIGILDATVQENSGFIAMEFVKGHDLLRYTKAGSLLPVADVLQMAFKCCGALEYAFREGIVHRDIKPANLMRAEGTDVKIADFGAAYLRKTQAVQTVAMGSPYYMSPEALQGKDLTFHSDMYSLGVVLYELLTGHRPFTAASLDGLRQKILQQEPAPPTKLRPDLPKEMDRIVLHALAKRPEQRYATWAEFAHALTQMVEKILPPTAIPDTEKYSALKKVQMLSGLSDYELWELAGAGVWMRVPGKQLIFRENEIGKKLYFLGKGQAKVSLKGRVLNMVNEGECFGEMAYLSVTGQERGATVTASRDSRIVRVKTADLGQASIACRSKFDRAFIGILVERLNLANTRLTSG